MYSVCNVTWYVGMATDALAVVKATDKDSGTCGRILYAIVAGNEQRLFNIDIYSGTSIDCVTVVYIIMSRKSCFYPDLFIRSSVKEMTSFDEILYVDGFALLDKIGILGCPRSLPASGKWNNIVSVVYTRKLLLYSVHRPVG